MDLKVFGGSYLDRTREIADYLHDIKDYPVLTEKEEDELIVKVKNGDEQAREKLIKCNLRFVFSIAKCYATDDKLMDLVSEGNIGLIQAIDFYDVNRPNRFLSYAVWYIRRNINYYLVNDNLLIRRTNNSKVSTKLNTINSKYYCENGRYPNEEEVIEILQKKYGIKIQYESDLYDVRTESINSTFDDNEANTFENSKEYITKTANRNEYETIMNNEHNEYLVNRILSTFNKRDRQILEMRNGVGKYKGHPYSNYSDIGEEMGMSGERVRQIIKRCDKKLKLAYHQIMK